MHVLNKGKNGEREIADLLRREIANVGQAQGFSPTVVSKAQDMVQRNQNQSANGGADIVCFGVAIEVKRQEALSLNNWWKQCTKSAEDITARGNPVVPVLLYRQNRQKWTCVMNMDMRLPNQDALRVRAETDLDSFLNWFHYWVIPYLKQIPE